MQKYALFSIIVLLIITGCGAEAQHPGGGKGMIAFTAMDADNQRSSSIFLMNVDGSELQALPNSGGNGSGWAPAWSPDGNWIVYIIHQSDNNWPLYVIAADGSNRQLLLSGDLCHFPAWSPDGTQITFSRNGNIWMGSVTIDGTPVSISDLRQLTFLEQQDASLSSWSPDGTQIVFASQMGDPHGTSSYYDPNSGEIYLINSDGTGLVNLTDDGFEDNAPDWSPDGSRIVFTSARDGDYEIYSMDPDGGNVQQLTDDPASDVSPSWSPDGSLIAFASDRDGNYEIYIMQADGSLQTRLTDTTTMDILPSWQP